MAIDPIGATPAPWLRVHLGRLEELSERARRFFERPNFKGIDPNLGDIGASLAHYSPLITDVVAASRALDWTISRRAPTFPELDWTIIRAPPPPRRAHPPPPRSSPPPASPAPAASGVEAPGPPPNPPQPRAKPRKRRRKGEARELLAATLDSLAAKGQWGKTDTEIIALADISRGRFYELIKKDESIKRNWEKYQRRTLGRGPVRRSDL